MLDRSSKAKKKARICSTVLPHPSLPAILYLGAIVRIKQTRCFLPVTTHCHSFCKHYTFDFIGIFKFDDEQDSHMNTDAFMQTQPPLAF